MPLQVLTLDSARYPISEVAITSQFVVLPTMADVREVLQTAHLATVVLLDPLDSEGNLNPDIRLLLADSGMIPVVAWMDVAAHVHIVPELFDLGIADVADVTLERTSLALLPRLEAAVGRPLKRRIEAALPRYLSQNAITLLRAAVDAVMRGNGTPALAASFGSTERTVSGWCSREGLPVPGRLQTWLRLLLALGLLESSDRTVLATALAAGYSAEHSLRRTLRTLLGQAAGSLRDCSLAFGIEGFVRELGEIRDLRRATSSG